MEAAFGERCRMAVVGWESVGIMELVRRARVNVWIASAATRGKVGAVDVAREYAGPIRHGSTAAKPCPACCDACGLRFGTLR